MPENFDYLKARDLFLNSFNDYDYKSLKIELKQPNITKIKKLLLEKSLNLKDKYILEIDKYLMNYYNNITNKKSKQIQTNLFKFIKKNN